MVHAPSLEPTSLDPKGDFNLGKPSSSVSREMASAPKDQVGVAQGWISALE